MEMEMKTEKCNSCKTMRTPSDFIYKQKVNKTCGVCWGNRKKNKEKINNRTNKYREANKEKIKNYREANKEKTKESDSIYRARIRKENPLLVKIQATIRKSKQSDIQKNRYDETNYVDMEHLFKLMEIQEGNCVYCGVEMVIDDFTLSKDGVSLQRIDNSLGHIKTNCVMSCFKCNNTRMEEGIPREFYQHILEQITINK